MASPRESSKRIRMKHILIALVGILATLLFIASIVLISIGYMNPFGTVGLGILGGGCVVFFSAVLFLCGSSIWIKNKYYPDEVDYVEKLVGGSIEDLRLLKSAAHVSSFEQPEDERYKENMIHGDNRNPVPLNSVSTVYTSVSSSASVAPENWQKNDGPEAMDADVFSSSLTASQHCDLKSQQPLELDDCISEPAARNSTGQTVQNIKYGGERQHAHVAVIDDRNYATELPQHRKSVDIINKTEGLPYDKQVEKRQIAITEDTYSTTLKEISDRKGRPVETPQTTSAFSPKGDLLNVHKGRGVKYFQETNQHKGRAQQNTQATNKHGSSIPDFAMQNTRKPNAEVIVPDKYLCSVPAGDLDSKHRSRENINKLSEDRSDIPLQYLLPKSKHAQKKVFFMNEAVKPTIRTGP